MTLFAGFGYRRKASADSLEDAYARALAKIGEADAADVFCAPADKIGAASAVAFAAARGVALTAVGAEEIADLRTPTQAEKVIEKRGVGSLAEAVAMAAAGPGGEVVVRRVVSADRMATCAIVKR